MFAYHATHGQLRDGAGKMLIAVAHGSRNPAWRASVEQQVEALQADMGADAVRLAYMELCPPSLLDVVREAVQCGTIRIRILPLFLAAEGHVDRDVRHSARWTSSC